MNRVEERERFFIPFLGQCKFGQPGNLVLSATVEGGKLVLTNGLTLKTGVEYKHQLIGQVDTAMLLLNFGYPLEDPTVETAKVSVKIGDKGEIHLKPDELSEELLAAVKKPAGLERQLAYLNEIVSLYQLDWDKYIYNLQESRKAFPETEALKNKELIFSAFFRKKQILGKHLQMALNSVDDLIKLN